VEIITQPIPTTTTLLTTPVLSMKTA